MRQLLALTPANGHLALGLLLTAVARVARRHHKQALIVPRAGRQTLLRTTKKEYSSGIDELDPPLIINNECDLPGTTLVNVQVKNLN